MRASLALLALGLLLAVPATQAGPLDDADADSVPDGAEPALCDADNRALGSDGTCHGEAMEDYAPPTGDGVAADWALVYGTAWDVVNS